MRLFDSIQVFPDERKFSTPSRSVQNFIVEVLLGLWDVWVLSSGDSGSDGCGTYDSAFCRSFLQLQKSRQVWLNPAFMDAKPSWSFKIKDSVNELQDTPAYCVSFNNIDPLHKRLLASCSGRRVESSFSNKTLSCFSELALFLQYFLSYSHSSQKQRPLHAICHLVSQQASPFRWMLP